MGSSPALTILLAFASVQVNVDCSKWMPSTAFTTGVRLLRLGELASAVINFQRATKLGDALGTYGLALVEHAGGNEVAFRQQAQQYLERAADCEVCELVALRDLTLSYATVSPTDVDRAWSYLRLGASGHYAVAERMLAGSGWSTFAHLVGLPALGASSACRPLSVEKEAFAWW